jgi:hypothetical protein
MLWDSYSPAAPAKAAAVGRASPRTQPSLQTLAVRPGRPPQTVATGRPRTTLQHAPRGPKPASTVLTAEEQALPVAFRRQTLLPPADGR